MMVECPGEHRIADAIEGAVAEVGEGKVRTPDGGSSCSTLDAIAVKL